MIRINIFNLFEFVVTNSWLKQKKAEKMYQRWKKIMRYLYLNKLILVLIGVFLLKNFWI